VDEVDRNEEVDLDGLDLVAAIPSLSFSRGFSHDGGWFLDLRVY
jgi:hypothetical protein